MIKSAQYFKMLILMIFGLSLFLVEAQADDQITPADYRSYSTNEHTRLEIVNVQKAQEIYNLMRLPELEQTPTPAENNKFKSFSNSTSDFFFFCGAVEGNSFVCYFQIKKVASDRLFESPSATSLKLNTASDSEKWSEILPAQTSPDGRNISSFIIENYLETYCEKSSANGETICHVTIYKKDKAELF